jgi:hypothetical protein
VAVSPQLPCGHERGRNAYDVGVGRHHHERVEGEDGGGAPGEGAAGSLRRRHPCS